MTTLVMKFGGAAVATPEQFSKIADLVVARKKDFPEMAIVVVVSAMGNTTDQLIALAKQVHPDPPRREYDMLVTVGERISISLLAMALSLKGQEAISFTGSQSGIITCPKHTDAHIIDIRPHRLLPYLADKKTVIVAGFQGVSQGGEITTLGRGGSDTSAVALGVALGAEKVEFYKDVPGIFEEDPKKNRDAKLYTSMTYDEAIFITKNGAKVLHSRCVELAKKNNLPLHVRTFYDSGLQKNDGTVIWDANGIRPSRPFYEQP